MTDKRNERTEYNWSYSGDDAVDYRSKYTQGFDPDYAKHAAERAEQQNEAVQQSERVRRQRQRPSARRARLSAQQEIVAERYSRPGTEEGRPEPESEADIPENGSPENRIPERKTPEKRTSRKQKRRSRNSGRSQAGNRSRSRTENRSSGRGQAGNRSGRSRSGRAAEAGRKNSAAYRKRIVRKRYAILGIAAAAGIFLLLFFANTYTLTITLSGDDPLYVELGDTYQDPGATAVYKGTLLHFSDREVPVIVDHNINNRVCGTYEVTYHAEYDDLETTAKRMVIIPDRTPPVLTLDNAVDVVRKGDEWVDSFTAIDDQDGDITANVEILGEVNMRRDGKYQLSYRVQDSAGNEATAERTVIVSSVAINRPETAKQGDKNVIYLTFDDGPGMYTERLLEILDNHNVKATFFVTDTNPASRDLIGEEYRRGHTIGLHTATHNYDIIYENAAAFWEDMDQEMAIIKEQTGSETKFMRFPGGSSNDLIVYDEEMQRSLAAGLRDRGLKYFDWTIDSYDSDDENTSDDIYWNMVDQSSVADPKMILCHDLKRTTVDAIDNFLSWAIENHYVFLPITEETPEVHHVELE